MIFRPTLTAIKWLGEKVAHQELQGRNTANPICTMKQRSQRVLEFTEVHSGSPFPLCCDLVQCREGKKKMMLLSQNGAKMIASS